jgi:hypothetical protein
LTLLGVRHADEVAQLAGHWKGWLSHRYLARQFALTNIEAASGGTARDSRLIKKKETPWSVTGGAIFYRRPTLKKEKRGRQCRIPKN